MVRESPMPAAHSSPQASSSSTGSGSSSEAERAKAARRKWTDEEAEIIVQVWSEFYEDLKKKRNKVVWQNITKQYNEIIAGRDDFEPREMAQVKSKIKNLTDAYKEAKTKNSKSGHGRETCAFYDLIDEVLGSREGTCPTTLLESCEASEVVEMDASLEEDGKTDSSLENEEEECEEQTRLDGDLPAQRELCRKRRRYKPDEREVPEGKKRNDEPKEKKKKRESKGEPADSLKSYLEESRKQDMEMMERLMDREKEMQTAEHDLLREFMGSIGEILKKK